MSKTISFHNGSEWSRGHNVRDERYTNKQEHIDSELTKNNITLCDVSVRQAYEEIFGQAVEEYNAKQKRSDRKIDCYYDKIKADKRKHPVYECIVQIGDRSDTGNSAELEKQALIRFAKEWNERNPNLHLVGAYVHCDEPDGTVHMHLDYIPVAECTRGMRLQNSLAKALEQQGFKFENVHQTAQIAWQEREREVLTFICHELGIDAQHNQGLSDNRKHLSKSEYIKEKEVLQGQINEELQPLKDELTKYKEKYKEFQISENDYSINAKKLPFQKKISMPISDFEQLQEQAKGYRLMKDDISIIENRKNEINSELEKQKTLSNELTLKKEEQDKKESELQSLKNTLEQDKKEVEKLKNDMNIKKLKEQNNDYLYDIRDLTEWKHKLLREIDEKEKNIQQLKNKFIEEREKIISECEMNFSSEREELKSNLQEYATMQEKLKKAYIFEKNAKEQVIQQNEKLTEQLKEKEKNISELTREKELLSKAIRFSGRDLVAEYQKHQEKLKQQRKQGMRR